MKKEHHHDFLRKAVIKAETIVTYRDWATLIVISILTGVSVAAFWICISLLWNAVEKVILVFRPAIIAFTTAGLTASQLIVRKFARIKETGCTTHDVLNAYHVHNGYLDPRDTLSKTVASVITLGMGGSAGPEGPSMLLGGGIAAVLSRKLRVSFHNLRRFFLSSAAAGVAAVFRAPFTGIFFALEIPYMRDIEYDVFLQAVVSSVTSYAMFVLICGPSHPYASIKMGFILTPNILLFSVIIGIIMAFLGRGFTALYGRWRKYAISLRSHMGSKGSIALSVIGGVAVGLMGLVDIRCIGMGSTLLHQMMSGGYRELVLILVLILVLKMLTTCTTLNFGGVGGLFIPTLFIGAVFSLAFAEALGLTPLEVYVAVGMASMLASCFKMLFTPVMFVAEVYGPFSIIPVSLAAVVSYMLSGQVSIVRPQFRHRIGPKAVAFSELLYTTMETKPSVLRRLKVRDVMTTHVVTINSDVRVKEALSIARRYGFTLYPVVDRDGMLLGYVSMDELVSLFEEGVDVPVTHALKSAVTVRHDESLYEAGPKLAESGEDACFVVDKSGRLMGMVLTKEVARILLRILFT